MNRRTLSFFLLGGVFVLSFSATSSCSRRPHISLPARAEYHRLPIQFQTALDAARSDVERNRDAADALRRLAHLYQANRLYREANVCYAELARTASGLTPQDHYLRADIAQDSGDLDGAQQELKAVISSEPRYLPAHLALAATLFKSGHTEEAAKEFQGVLAAEPNNRDASLELARIELQHQNEDAAVARLENLLATHPDATAAAAALAQVLSGRGEKERAAALTEWSQQKHEPAPLDPWKDQLLTDCYDPQLLGLACEELLNSAQFERTLPLLTRIEELDAKSWVPQLLRGWSQLRTRHFIDAAQELRGALGKGADPEKICPLLVEALIGAGQLSEASALVGSYLAKAPESPILLGLASNLALREGKTKDAQSLLSRQLEKEPYDSAANLMLAKLLWGAGDREAAVPHLKKILQVAPFDLTALGLVAQYHLEKGEAISAILPLEKALAQAAPRGSEAARDQLRVMLQAAYLQTGIAKAKDGAFVDAIDYYDKSIALAPADLEGYVYKANSCVQLKQFARAAETLEKMHTLQPGNPTILLSWGDVLYQSGDAAGARARWEDASKLVAPGDAGIRAAITERLAGRIGPNMFE